MSRGTTAAPPWRLRNSTSGWRGSRERWDSCKNYSYPDGQSVSSYLTVEPFAVLFWALWIVLGNTWPCPLVAGIAPPLYSQHFLLYMVMESWFNSYRRRFATHPPFSYLGMINLWGPAFFTVSYKKKFQLMTGGNFNLETILTEICLKSHFRPFFLFAASDKKFLLEPVLRLQTFWARSRYD